MNFRTNPSTQSFSLSTPRPFGRWLLVGLGIYWVALIYQLSAQWSIYEQYNYGWAVPFLSLYLAGRRWPELPPPQPALQILGVGTILIVCSLLYAPTRLLHEANPIWRLSSLLWTLEVIGLTLAIMTLVGGNAWLKKLAFPICFFLVAVPWPTDLETSVIQNLTRANTAATVESIGALGIPAIQHGNVIELASGRVGIDEACSGIRSVQATLMLALFFGEFFRLTFFRRALCVLAGFAFSFFFNLLRTTLLTWVAETRGTAAVALWHDPAGGSILVAAFVCLWLVARWQGKEAPKSESAKSSEPVVGFTGKILPRDFSFLALGLIVWFVFVEGGTEFWFRKHEQNAVLNSNWVSNFPTGSPGFQTVELSSEVRGRLQFDEGKSARWQVDGGFGCQVFDLNWNPARSLYERVKVSLTKSHNPEICLPAAGMKMVSELPPISYSMAPGREIEFNRYIFDAEGRKVHVYFSVAEFMRGTKSPGFLRMTSWQRVRAALAGSRNFGQHTLEVAIWGTDNAETADAAFQQEMKRIVAVHR